MVLIDYPTVVVDEEQKTIIQYCADGNVDVLSMQICSLISEGVNLSEYRIRVVSDIESFVEKVQIVSAGYDDRAIELMKYMNSPLEDVILMFITQTGDARFNIFKEDIKKSLVFKPSVVTNEDSKEIEASVTQTEGVENE